MLGRVRILTLPKAADPLGEIAATVGVAERQVWATSTQRPSPATTIDEAAGQKLTTARSPHNIFVYTNMNERYDDDLAKDNQHRVPGVRRREQDSPVKPAARRRGLRLRPVRRAGHAAA